MTQTYIAADQAEATESFIGTGKFDPKGREIGFTVGLSDNIKNGGSEYFAWVQASRKINGNFSDFGVPQRSRAFPTQEAATNWGFATAKERAAKVKSN